MEYGRAPRKPRTRRARWPAANATATLLQVTNPPPAPSLITAYACTRWEVETAAGAREIRIGREAPAELRRTAILTGWNPRSLRRPQHENEAANRHLATRLLRAGATLAAAVALAPDDPAGRWREPGFLVRGISREEAARIAARYGQNAIVWIGDDAVPVLVTARHGFGGAGTGHRIAIS